jgi:hypothetical protein
LFVVVTAIAVTADDSRDNLPSMKVIRKAIRWMALGILMGLPALVLAQNGPRPGERGDRGEVGRDWEACRADAARLCRDTPRGHGQIRECLKAHEAELSDACRAALNDAR